MFDIGWSEMAVVALVALLIIGPKDLPKVMRSAAHWARKARGLAREFQSGVDDMIRDADLEDARKSMDSVRSLDVRKAIGDTVDPTGDLRDEANDIEKTARDADAMDDSVDDGGNDEEVAKDVVNTEAEPNIAPPHSLTPPEDSPEPPPNPEPPNPEPPNPAPASQPAADDSADKRAS